MISSREKLMNTKFNAGYCGDAVNHRLAGLFYDACDKLGVEVMGGGGRDYFMTAIASDSLVWLCISDGKAFARKVINENSVHGHDSKSMIDFKEIYEDDLRAAALEKPQPRTKTVV